jgi:hypothetical protein
MNFDAFVQLCDVIRRCNARENELNIHLNMPNINEEDKERSSRIMNRAIITRIRCERWMDSFEKNYPQKYNTFLQLERKNR